jgi:alkylation response protein AidB-like acyl-CoA dehydrogenase
MDDVQRRLAEELLFSGEKKPSFAKILFLGISDSPRVFPFPSPSSDIKTQTDTLIQNLKDFSDKEIDPDKIDREANIPTKVIQGLGKLGLLGLTIPKEFGGQGLPQYTYCKATELIGGVCGSTALFVNAHQSIGLKALVLFGTPGQKKKWLPRLSSGEQLAAFALTEPNAGSDASGIETRADYNPQTKTYTINGKKQWITNGGIAGVLTVMAKMSMETPNGIQEKITAFLVTPDMPGFKIKEASLEKVGMRGSKTSILEFENLEVPEENVLGPVGGGLKVCLTVLDYGRTTFGATCTGAAKYLFEKALSHAKHRFQFKRSLASFPLVKKKLALMSATIYAMESATYLTAGLLDRGEEDIMLEAAMLKVFNSESLWKILYDTMQIYGGRSFFTDHPFERMMRDARLNMIGEGSNEVLQAFIGLVGLRDVGIQFKGVWDELQNPFSGMNKTFAYIRSLWVKDRLSKIPIQSSALKSEAEQLVSSIRQFGNLVTKVLAKHKEDVIEKQLILDRLARISTFLYVMSATLSRLDSELVQNKVKENDSTCRSAKLFFYHSLDKINLLSRSMFDNRDDLIESLSDQLTGVKI